MKSSTFTLHVFLTQKRRHYEWSQLAITVPGIIVAPMALVIESRTHCHSVLASSRFASLVVSDGTQRTKGGGNVCYAMWSPSPLAHLVTKS